MGPFVVGVEGVVSCAYYVQGHPACGAEAGGRLIPL